MTILDNARDAFTLKETAVALGIFDGLHIGHMTVINALVVTALKDGLAPCVFTFNMDSHKPPPKSGESIMSFEMWNGVLQKAGVEYVLRPDFSEFRGMSPEAFSIFLIDSMHAKAVFCGENFRFGKNAAAGAGDLKALLGSRAEAHIINTVTESGGGVSSTRIKDLLKEGAVDTANKLLGRPFSINSPVVHGRGLGHRLGAPTINQIYPENIIRPRFGVYASVTRLGEAKYPSVTNIGVKPTVGAGPVAAETHVIGYSGDLYGERAEVFLLRFIRSEKKFEELEALKAQIEKDVGEAYEIYKLGEFR